MFQESGFGFRLALLPFPPVPSASANVHPCGCSPLPRWSWPRAPLRFRRAAQPLCSISTQRQASRIGPWCVGS
jgi:hypothetical protein